MSMETGSLADVDAGAVKWKDVRRVQQLIEHCLQQCMSQTEVITALHAQANVDPSLTCLVWQKLEEQNEAFFYAYAMRLRLKDQIVAFNYLASQQRRVEAGRPLAAPDAPAQETPARPPASSAVRMPADGSVPAPAAAPAQATPARRDAGDVSATTATQQELDVAAFLANTPTGARAAGRTFFGDSDGGEEGLDETGQRDASVRINLGGRLQGEATDDQARAAAGRRGE